MVKPDYTVRLEQVFQGPLDLLLHLVREQEVEIHEIEIAKILQGYLGYLESLEKLDIEYAGDFLVMAATLMSIKSRSLLPNEEVNLEDEIDPRDELIQRLMEYRRFKDAADDLEDRYRERASMHPRGWHEDLRPDEPEFDLGELTVWDMLTIYSRLMRETLADRPHAVAGDPRPLRFYVESVVLKLKQAGSASLRGVVEAYDGVPEREALIGSFCALLELVRLELVDVEQDDTGEDIGIRLREERGDELEEVVRMSVFDEERTPETPENELSRVREGRKRAQRT